jgi:hypothetical protein
MSTGLGCSFVHLTSGWYYFLESGVYHEVYHAWGPFPSFDAAYEHLRDNQANPGGFMAPPHDAPAHEPNAYEAELIKNARR